MTTYRIMGIDPSLSETGAALLSSDGDKLTGKLDGAWRIRTKSEGALHDRIIDLATQVRDLIAKEDPDIVAVELPVNRPMGGHSFSRRSVLDLPNYGMAVGAALMAAAWTPRLLTKHPRTLLAPSVSDWTGKDIPSTRDDAHKEKRVAYVERLYRLQKGALGPKTYAGNQADAILIARHALWRMELDPWRPCCFASPSSPAASFSASEP